MGKRVYCVSVLEGGLGGALSVDRGWLLLPIRLQQYCDPVSLVRLKGAHITLIDLQSTGICCLVNKKKEIRF